MYLNTSKVSLDRSRPQRWYPCTPGIVLEWAESSARTRQSRYYPKLLNLRPLYTTSISKRTKILRDIEDGGRTKDQLASGYTIIHLDTGHA